MPGTRRARRNSNNASSESSRGWTALSSRESLPRRPVKTASKHSQNKAGSVPIWPLPPRLTRSTTSPPTKIHAPSRSPKHEEKSSEPYKLQDIEFSALNPKNMDENTSLSPRSGQEASPASVLKMKPLLHSKQRSVSAGLILQRPEGEVKHAEELSHLKLPENPEMTKPHLPRSASLCSQHAGKVPTKPIPPLPYNLPATNRVQKIRSLIEESFTRVSGNSLLSGDTSILDDCLSRTLSHAETNLTSISALSPGFLSSELGRAGKSDTEKHTWRSSTSDGSSLPLSVSKADEQQAKAEVRKSCRASIVQSLPRSASSGLSLSLSLAPGSSRDVSSTSLYNDKVLPSRTPSLMVPNTLEGKGSRRGKSPASPLRNSTTFDSRGELKVEKKLPSTLQVISGNEGSIEASKPDKILSSGENQMFQWDPVSPMQPGKPSAAKERTKGHLRQTDLKIQKSAESNVCISDISLAGLPSASPPIKSISTEPSEQKTSSTCLQPSAKGLLLPRPPTRVTFDPQIVSDTYQSFERDMRFNGDSPTLSIFQYNADNSSSSSESLMSSPSLRRGSATHHRQPGSNPNRSKPVFSIPGEGHWSIMNFDSSFIVDPTKPILETTQPNEQQAFNAAMLSPHISTGSATSRPYSFLHPIPSEHDMPTRRSSPGSSPIRGPRAAPSRRSPMRGIGKPSSSYGIIGSGRDLRKSVMALRRQNSEAQNSPLQEHRNYLDIDGRSERPLEGGFASEFNAAGGLRSLLEQKGRPESPGTLYDSSGFLKE